MTGLKWFPLKNEDTHNSQLNIPLKFICLNSKQISVLNDDKLKISSDKIKFDIFHKDCVKSVEINRVDIKEVQYSDTNDIIRINLNANIYSKYFANKTVEDDLFKDTIWFFLNVKDNKVVLKSLMLKCLTLFTVSRMPLKIQRQFLKIIGHISADHDVKHENNLNAEKPVQISEKIKLCPKIVDLKMLSSLEKNTIVYVKNVKRLITSPLKGDVLKRKLVRSTTIPSNEPKRKLILRSTRKLLYSPSPLHSMEITEIDLRCLSAGKYLNDNIINLYLTYTYFEKLSQTQRESTYFFNVFFNTKLIGTMEQQKVDTAATRHARVAKWTKNVDIFSKDFIVMPVIEDEHWFLVIVCFPWMAGMVNYSELFNNHSTTTIPINTTYFATNDRVNKCLALQKDMDINAMPCILILDSIEFQSRVEKVNIIREYLKSEWDARRKSNDGPLVFDKTTCRGYSPIVLKQDNGTDCGLYLLQYVESFFTTPLKSYDREEFRRGFLNWFKRSDMNLKRGQMKSLILSKTIEVLPVDDNDDDDCVNIL